MEPLTIAGLTVLALIGLAVEYFTRLISRCLGVAWGLLKQAFPAAGDAHEEGPVSGELLAGHEATGRSAIVDARPWLAYVRPGTQIADVLPPSPQVHVGQRLEVVREQKPSSEWVEPTQNTNPTGVVGEGVSTEAEARVSAEVMTIVAQLVSVENNLRRGGILDEGATALVQLKTLAMNYALDDLMSISDHALNREAITYYQDVARTVLELEEFILNASSAQPFEDRDRVEQGKLALQASVADEIARGTRVAKRLRGEAEDPASQSPTDSRLTAS